MKNVDTTIHSKQELNLQIELIINRNLYSRNMIIKDEYSIVEQNLLKDIEKEKAKFNM